MSDELILNKKINIIVNSIILTVLILIQKSTLILRNSMPNINESAVNVKERDLFLNGRNQYMK